MKKNPKKIAKNIYLKTYLWGVLASSILLPGILSAQQTYPQNLSGLINLLQDVIGNAILWILVTGAVIIFLAYLAWQIFKISQKGAMDSEAKKYILYGLIALTLMFTFYGVTALLASTFGIQIGIPQFFTERKESGDTSEPNYSIINR